MSINLERLLDGSPTARNFDLLKSLVIDTGGREIGVRFGTGTFAFTGTTEAATATVTHGLGRAPVAVFVQPFAAPAAGNRPITSTGTPNATAFAVGGEVKTAFTGNVSFFWLAIG